MKNYLKTFENFEVKDIQPINETLLESGEAVNEGLFDKLTSMFSKFIPLFKDAEKLKKATTTTITQAGPKALKLIPKAYKPNESIMLVLGDGKNSALDFNISMTKLADLPDGSGLFQITGASSPQMIKALAGTDKIEDLSKNSVMAMISPMGLEKGKIATMKLLKNILPGGKDYVTKTFVQGVVPMIAVEANIKKVVK
jgi:hypothetical protein